MPRIEITELDLTNSISQSATTDVVYIPGFVDLTQPELFDEDGKYIGLEAFVPKYFNNVHAFETAVGARGAKFETDQFYTDLITMQSDGSFTGFSADAIPYNKVMFPADTIDPSYIMAKELLAAGLPIVYERMNKDPDYVKVTKEPSDWNTSYVNYYNKINVYTPIDSVTVPAFFTEYNQGDLVVSSTQDVNPKYYTRVINEETLEATYKPVELSEITTMVEDKAYFTTKCFKRADNSISYYSFEPVSFKKQPEFEAGKYYIMSEATGVNKDNCSSYFVEDGTEYVPAEADSFSEDVTYYEYHDATEEEFISGADNIVVTADSNVFSKVTFTYLPKFEAGKYYIPEINSNGYVVLTKEPDDWSQDEVFERKDYLEDKFKGGQITIPADWAKTYGDYFESSEIISSLENVSANEEIPQFKDIYEYTNFIDINSMYKGLETAYDIKREEGLTDMGHTSIKYLTSGGYPTYEYNDGQLVNAMISVAAERGDCVAFIDHTDNLGRSTNPNNPSSVYAKIISDASFGVNGDFATMFTPWMNHTRITTDKNSTFDAIITMSATFSYLLALAQSIKTNANWLAIAGSTRGQVPNLQSIPCDTVITNGVADTMQPRDNYSINAITNIEPYGHVIWGNRTLKNNALEGNLTATSFLNIRNLVSDIKKLCYATCKKYTFEPNNDVLWVNIKSSLQPTLQRMTSGYGISGFKIVRDLEHEKASEKATLCFKVILYPVYAVEDFHITVILTDDEVSVE